MKFNILGAFRKILKSVKKKEASAKHLRNDENLPVSEAGQTVPDAPASFGGSVPAPVTGMETVQLRDTVREDDPSPASPLKTAPPDDPIFGRSTAREPAPEGDAVQVPASHDEIKNHPDISASMQALRQKYNLSEITIITDDGLVLATSAGRDVEFDAVHYSLVTLLMTSPSEPDVKLFELKHKGSPLIGIIRSTRYVSPALKEQIRGDTKAILQWWL